MTLAAGSGVSIDLSRDHTVASPARIRDAALGGKDSYAADRTALDALEAAAPGFAALLRTTRAWHVRIVRLLASRGFDQFLDLAAGLPTARENTHQTAQRQNAEAKVVYTDTDRLVLTYGRALLTDNDRTQVVHADHLDPFRLLDLEQVNTALDLTRPVVLLMTTGAQHDPDDDRLAAALAGYRQLLPRGSVLALSCWSPPTGSSAAELLAQGIERNWEFHCRRAVRYRSHAGVQQLFAGFTLLEPGLIRLDHWWPDGPALRAPRPAQQLAFGGVGTKH
ncbi:SAM-dependent methyltransferase [Amycolatopsis sp. NBC_01488]|uniref:SAM-dependent methyltransferase n=1 Tax=Amycolatopsis sp. NBC_01488 TaxID=2903563 RepID=UPI002E2B7EF5|nr:SAM-dependent methyltransferase [Amycolatopsis sp. NBC_01488]